MILNRSDFWECPACRLQAHSGSMGMFAVLNERGVGNLKTTKATDQIVGWVLTRAMPSEHGVRADSSGFSSEEEFRQYLDLHPAEVQSQTVGDVLTDEESDSLWNMDHQEKFNIRTLPGSDIRIFTKDILRGYIEINCSMPDYGGLIIYVETDESLVFWQLVQPLAKQLAGEKQVILLDQDSPLPEIDSLRQFALICLDAGVMAAQFLKCLARGESPLSPLLNSNTIHSLVYLHGIHRCTEKIHHHVVDLVDPKSSRPCSRAVISGIHGHPNNLNAVTPNIANRCSVFALE